MVGTSDLARAGAVDCSSTEILDLFLGSTLNRLGFRGFGFRGLGFRAELPFLPSLSVLDFRRGLGWATLLV